jgi:hypothetical protein
MSWEDRERKLAKRGKFKVHNRRFLELISNSQENKTKKKRGKSNEDWHNIRNSSFSAS